MYTLGQGVPQDYAEAAKWNRLAADQGFAEAQASLGVAYIQGQGVPQDYAEAVKWCRKAADQGIARAQGALGLMYEQGWGVAQDYVLAYTWLNLSASREYVAEGRDILTKLRDEVAAMMTPSQIAEAQRMAREWKPTAADGSPAAKP